MMREEKKLAVVACCDDNFTCHLAAMIVSVLENCYQANKRLTFYVIEDEISDTNKRLLIETLDHYNQELHFLTIDKGIFSHAITSNRIPKTAYYRIVIPELLRDENADRIVYLDCDMLACTDISTLLDIDLGEYPLAAVEDSGFHDRLRKMNIQSKSDLYFNSGFLLINTPVWLDNNITKRVLRFIERYPSKLKFHDQDALNAVLHDKWLRLHPRWNTQSYILTKEKRHPTREGEKEYAEARKNPAIIHYTGHTKPWDDDYNVWFVKDLYTDCAGKTAFSKSVSIY